MLAETSLGGSPEAMKKVRPAVPKATYHSEVYQSVEIYQTKSRLLSWYYWGRVTTAVSMLLERVGGLEGGRLLDLGCGSGMTLPTLQEYFENVTATDIYTEHAAKVARLEGLGRVAVLTGDGRDLPFRDESFGVVLLMDILEHVEGRKDRLISECGRVLKEGGYLACSLPVEVGPVVLLRQAGRRFFGLEGNRQGLRETMSTPSGGARTIQLEPSIPGTHTTRHIGGTTTRVTCWP